MQHRNYAPHPGERWTMSLQISEHEIRELAAGTLPRRIRIEARKALVWFDEGIAAGMRQMQHSRNGASDGKK